VLWMFDSRRRGPVSWGIHCGIVCELGLNSSRWVATGARRPTRRRSSLVRDGEVRCQWLVSELQAELRWSTSLGPTLQINMARRFLRISDGSDRAKATTASEASFSVDVVDASQ